MGQPLPAQRHRRILDVLRERQAARVSTLSQLLGVSEVTIRRDLEDLEHRGLLERTHGGAIAAQRMRTEPAYAEAIDRHADEKRRIAAAAAALAEPGDTVFLNGGTTTMQVFRHLPPGVRVVTNHVGVAMESSDHAGDVLIVGGEYRAPSHSVAGAWATESIRRVFATRAFLGAEGVSRRAGVTTPVAAEADIARVMLEQTRGPVFVVCDHSKIGTVADFAIAGLNELAGIVTDDGIDDEYREDLMDQGLEVIVAGERVHVPRRGG